MSNMIIYLQQNKKNDHIYMSNTIVVLVCVLSLSLALVSHAGSMAQVFVKLHNKVRKEVGHGIGPLEWNSTLQSYAGAYARYQESRGCKHAHSNGPYGENIFWGSGEGWMDPKAAMITWVDEEKDYYDYKTNTCLENKDCWHYTQVIWKNTNQLGCALANCPDSSVFITCNYYPPGNYIGERPY